ncbi:hypothetical protein ACVIYL_009000 [Bradyrhizobium sp. USDA 3315]
MREQLAKLSRGHDLAKAFNYILKRWASFTLFLEDGRVCLSNNAAERGLRGIALGRKAWPFCGSDRGGRRAASMYSLIVTCLCRARHRQVYAARRTMPSRVVFPRFSLISVWSVRHSSFCASAFNSGEQEDGS